MAQTHQDMTNARLAREYSATQGHRHGASKRMLGSLVGLATLLCSPCGDAIAASVEPAPPAAISQLWCSPQTMHGSHLLVQLGHRITTQTAQPGDVWHGTVAVDVVFGASMLVRAGSLVTGVVTVVAPAARGSRAMLGLALRLIRRNGHDEPVAADLGEIVAGSTRARNIGAVALNPTAAGPLAMSSDGDQIDLQHGVLLNFTAFQGGLLR